VAHRAVPGRYLAAVLGAGVGVREELGAVKGESDERKSDWDSG
jgi:hypothetical protein